MTSRSRDRAIPAPPRPFGLRLPLLLLVLLSLAACVSTTPPAAPAPAPLVLVSIDGFRADYLDAGLAPNLARIAGEGVRAQWQNPPYRSEEHTSELQSLMRISYAAVCLN